MSGLTGHAPGYWVVSPAQSPDFVFSEGQDFVGPGDFRLLIGAGRGGASWQDAGAYRLTLMRLDTLLEAGGAPLAIGDSSVQAIDARRDVDRFRVAGAPGSTVRVQLETSAAGASLEVFDSAQQRWVRASYYGTAVVTSAPVVVPPSGSLAVDVLETCAGTVCTLPNQYTLRVLGPGT